MLFQSVNEALTELCGLDPRRITVVGVSGGPDSLALLDAMQAGGYALIAAHLNHGLRPEAGTEAQAVAGFAAARGVPFALEQADIRAVAQAGRQSLEEAARQVRYRFLFRLARERGAQAVAVAHTASDQVETVLMHFLRGAGLAGLKGMRSRSVLPEWDAEIPLVRPLLGVWRADVLEYCRLRGLQPHFDASNADPAFFRNRLRHQLIPILEEYNPQFQPAVWRAAQALAGDADLLAELQAAAWQTCAPQVSLERILLNADALRAQPPAMQRRLLRQAVSGLLPDLRDMDFSQVERALAFIARPSRSGQIDLAGGVRLAIQGQQVWIGRWSAAHSGVSDLAEYPQLDPPEVAPLPVPGELLLANGWRLRAEWAPAAEALQQAADQTDRPPTAGQTGRHQAWLAVSPDQPLAVRGRQPGDRFAPLGLRGQRARLSDLFINARIPAAAREHWPLVCQGNDIIWVPGLAPAYANRLTVETSQAVHIWVERVDGAIRRPEQPGPTAGAA